MAVDDAIVDSPQIMKERPDGHLYIPNVDDASETLHQSMKKNVDETCEMLEATKSDLEKETLVVDMESKVNMLVTEIQGRLILQSTSSK